MSILTFSVAISHISCAQSTHINPAYIVTTAGDTIRNFEIKKSRKLTNEDKVTYFYNDSEISLPSNSIRSYFNGSDLFVSELLKNENKHILISYIIGGSVSFGQSFSRKGEAIFYLKRSDTQEIVCLANHKYNLLPLVKSFLPDFEAFYRTWDAKIHYDFKSIAELITAYNAFKEPSVFVPVKYKFKENIKFGVNGSLGIGSLKPINDHSDFAGKSNYSFGLNYKQFYTRSISFNFSLSYNNSSFTATHEDVYLKDISFDPNMGFRTIILPRLDITLKGGLNIGYFINSYLSQNTIGGNVLDITGFHFGPKIGIEVTYLKKYCIFINYLSYKINTNERLTFVEDLHTTAKNLQFGLIYYFGSIYPK